VHPNLQSIEGCNPSDLPGAAGFITASLCLEVCNGFQLELRESRRAGRLVYWVSSRLVVDIAVGLVWTYGFQWSQQHVFCAPIPIAQLPCTLSQDVPVFLTGQINRRAIYRSVVRSDLVGLLESRPWHKPVR
jgi:hypothetical protein